MKAIRRKGGLYIVATEEPTREVLRTPDGVTPLGFKDHYFTVYDDRRPGLLRPFGGIMLDGTVHLAGFQIEASEDGARQLFAATEKTRRKSLRHIARDQTGKYLCGRRAKEGTDRTPIGPTEPICTKHGRGLEGNGLPRWCSRCIAKMREIYPSERGRVTHLLQQVVEEWAIQELGIKPEEGTITLLTRDDRDHEEANYGYCIECRQEQHKREEHPTTDWNRRAT